MTTNTAKHFETILLNSCSSTMDEAKKHVQEKKLNHVFCVISERQTQGRGRGGSSWVQHIENLTQEVPQVHYFQSLANALQNQHDFLPLTFAIPTFQLKIPIEWISILVGCAIYDALSQTEIFLKNAFPSIIKQTEKNSLYIKWPNDIITFPNGKKIAGILCETSSANAKINEIFIGIGLNLFTHPKLENSTSFFEYLFKSPLNNDFIQPTLQYFANKLCLEIEEYLFHSRSIDQLKNLALERFLPKGTILSVNKGKIKGKFHDLTSNGALLLEGNNEPIYSGDITFVAENIDESKKTEKLFHTHLEQSNKNLIIQKEKKKIAPLIAIDFGNTRLHLANKNSLCSTKYINLTYDHLNYTDSTKIKSVLKPILENIMEDRTETISICYCSVISPEKTSENINNFTNFLKKIFPEIKFQGYKLTEKEIFEKINLQGNYTFHRLGMDRALKFYFAFQEAIKTQNNILVFSFGTATTCEGVSKDGFILENFVFPGIQMSLNALHDYTALLPSLSADPSLFYPEGKNWNQEIYLQRGVFMSVVGSILTTAKLHSPCICYFSGGNSEQIASIVNDLAEKMNFQIQFELLANLETNIILEIANQHIEFIKKKHNPTQFRLLTAENSNINNIASKIILNSMIKSRIKLKEERNVEIKEQDFRRIGGRIENSDEERFDLYMAQKFKFHTREEWRERILNSEVMIEHNSAREIIHAKKPSLTKVKPTYKIKNFDQIWLFHPPEYEPEIVSTIHLLYDNEDICIFSKPPNLVIHAAGLYLKNTFIEHIEKMGYENCSPVHRIDRETSGILVCARKAETRKILSNAFRFSKVKKMYLAVTKGTRELPNKFMVNLPIGEPENSLIRLKLWVNGKNPQPAKTFFAKLSSFNDYTLFACLPVTGRTNQIRVHLAAIGHWIVGDKMYHENENVFIEFYEKGFTQWVHEQVIFPRHMLHNTGIMVDSEIKIEPLSFEPVLSPIPEDMIECSIVKKLMEQANLPIHEGEQIKFLKKLFLELHNSNFDREIFIEGDNHEEK